jgi:Ca2+-binding RTX toxin-like protein
MTTISGPSPWPAAGAVVGTDEADTVFVRKIGEDRYEVEFNGEIREISGQQLAALRFDMRGGDDWFIVDDDVNVSVWVYGGSGEDWLQGGAGNDYLRGGDDDDRVFGGAGADHVYGGGGNDELQGEDGNDELSDVYGNNRMDGGAGNDQMLVGLDMGRPPEAWHNTLVDFDDLADARANGGWTQYVRPMKVAGPYFSPSWHLQTYIPLLDDKEPTRAAANPSSGERRLAHGALGTKVPFYKCS